MLSIGPQSHYINPSALNNNFPSGCLAKNPHVANLLWFPAKLLPHCIIVLFHRTFRV